MIRSQRHLNFALKAIHNSPKGRDYFLGACLTKGSRVLSKAENSTKSPKQRSLEEGDSSPLLSKLPCGAVSNQESTW